MRSLFVAAAFALLYGAAGAQSLPSGTPTAPQTPMMVGPPLPEDEVAIGEPGPVTDEPLPEINGVSGQNASFPGLPRPCMSATSSPLPVACPATDEGLRELALCDAEAAQLCRQLRQSSVSRRN